MKKINPPAYLGVCLIISTAIHFLFPIKQLVVSPHNRIGVLILLAGFVLILWAGSIFRKAKTTIMPKQNPTALIDWGPFAFSRNPIYLGAFLILAGISVLLGSVSAFVGPALFIVAGEYFFVPAEERKMEKAFKEKYLKYKNKVRRWL